MNLQSVEGRAALIEKRESPFKKKNLLIRNVSVNDLPKESLISFSLQVKKTERDLKSSR